MEALHQRLDREADEQGLWEMPRAAARDRLIEHYLPFAEALAQAKASRNKRVEFDDCYQEAAIALMGAVDAYNPEDCNGATFTTFASLRVRGGTVEAERKNDWVGHKVRSEHGDVLPSMGHFKDGCGFMAPKEDEDEELGAATRLAAILERMDPVAASRLESFVACGGDLDVWAKAEGVFVPQARLNLTRAVIKAQCVPVDADGETSEGMVIRQAIRKAAA